jgi:hypothetical protein
MMNFNVSLSSSNGLIIVSGNFTVKEKIYGPLSISFEAGRCSSDLNNCENFGTYNVKKGCMIFINSTSLFSKPARSIVPPVKCPVTVGNYTLKNTELDTSNFAFLPLDGYIFNVIITAVSTDPLTKSKILVFCLKIEVKIERKRVN